MKKHVYYLALFILWNSFFAGTIHAQSVLWAGKGSSEGFDNGNAIVSDDSGNVYVTGQTEFSATYGTHILNSWGSHDILVGKYSTDGSIRWIHNAGGRGGDVGHGIGVDAVHNTYIIGEIEDTADFGSGISVKSNGANDIFIAKYNLAGNISWAKGFGSSGNDKGEAIVVTPSGDSYMTGYFSSGTTFDGTTLNSVGGYDIFLIKTNSAGQVQWAKKAGGEGNDRGNGIAIDASGNIYVTGTFYQSATFNNTTISCPTKTGTFLAKYDSTGQLQWATAAGSCCDTTKSNAISLDENGNVYITGYFKNETKFGPYTFTAKGISDVFIAKYDPSGNVVWAKQAGGDDDDGADGICVDKLNHLVYITGQVHTNGYFDSCYYQIKGFMDIFIAAYNMDGKAVWLKTYGGGYRDAGAAITVDNRGYIYSTGLFNDVAKFDTITLTGYPNQPWADFYVDKISPAMAELPLVASSNLVVEADHCSDLRLSFSPGNGNKRIIIARQSTPVNSFPLNGNNYSANSIFGNGYELGNGNFVVYNGTGNNIVVTNLIPGASYYFSVIEYNGFGMSSNYMINNPAGINAISKIFPITITSLQNTICDGDSMDLHASGAISYSWSHLNSLTNLSDSIVTSIAHSTTTYTVNGMTADGCYAEGNITINVNPVPVVNFSSQDGVCLNNPPATLSGGSPVGGIYSGNGVSGDQFIPALTGSGTFPLYYEFTNEYGCKNIAQSSIKVFAIPVVMLNEIPSLCTNESTVTLNNGIPSGGSYTGVGISGGMFNPSLGEGTYPINYSYTDNNGCSANASNNIVVNPAPSVNIGNDFILCYGNSATLNAGAGFVSYLWSTGETSSSIVVDSSGMGTGIKDVFVIVSNSSGCKASDAIRITFDICAGINPPATELNNLTFYPNPFSTNITLTSEKTVSVCVYDICGKLVDQKENVTGKITLGENLNQGVYFINLISESGKKVFTVLKSGL